MTQEVLLDRSAVVEERQGCDIFPVLLGDFMFTNKSGQRHCTVSSRSLHVTTAETACKPLKNTCLEPCNSYPFARNK
jgi:hypothetical protein